MSSKLGTSISMKDTSIIDSSLFCILKILGTTKVTSLHLQTIQTTSSEATACYIIYCVWLWNIDWNIHCYNILMHNLQKSARNITLWLHCAQLFHHQLVWRRQCHLEHLQESCKDNFGFNLLIRSEISMLISINKHCVVSFIVLNSPWQSGVQYKSDGRHQMESR